MASITASGVGSGLDVASIVSQLMSVERAPINALVKQVTSFQSRLSALGQMKSAMSTLQTSAEALARPDKFSAYKTTVGDATLFSATAGPTATAGSYAIEVKQLAQSHKLASAGFASTTSTVGTGTLKIELGDLAGGVYAPEANKTLTLTVDATNNTLAGVRDAINAAKKGVTATIVNDGSGNPARLVITADNSGTTNSIRMSGLAGLDYDPVAATGGMEEKVVAQNALVEIDKIAITRPTNSIADAIEGVTLNLTKSNLGSTTTLAIATDSEAVKKNIEGFVKAYNDLNSLMRSQTAYNATAKSAGALNGDSTVRTIASRLRGIAGDGVTGGDYSRLSEVGITFQTDGSLKIDSTKLDATIADKSKDLAGLFGNATGTAGIAAKLAKEVKSMLGVDGLLTNRTAGINSTIERLNDRKDDLEFRMTRIEARLQKQFNALDAVMTSMNTTSQYLSQQIAAMSNNN